MARLVIWWLLILGVLALAAACWLPPHVQMTINGQPPTEFAGGLSGVLVVIVTMLALMLAGLAAFCAVVGSVGLILLVIGGLLALALACLLPFLSPLILLVLAVYLLSRRRNR